MNQDNFVMLCPLHLSSKLPSESAGSQDRRKKCTPKRYVDIFPLSSKVFSTAFLQHKLLLCTFCLTFLFRKLSQRDFVASKHEISISRNFNFSVSSKKLILCCSALTTPDWVKLSTDRAQFLHFLKEI